MKRIKYIILLLFIVQGCLFSQTTFEPKRNILETQVDDFKPILSLGLTGLIAFHNHSNFEYVNKIPVFDNLYNLNSQDRSYTFGITANLIITEGTENKQSLTLDFLYDSRSYRNGSWVVELDASTTQNPDRRLEAVYDIGFDVDYIQTSLLYDYYIFGTTIALSAGPTFRYLLDGSVHERAIYRGSLEGLDEDLWLREKQEDITDEMTNLLISFKLQFSYTVFISDFTLLIRAGYEFPFSSNWNNMQWSTSTVASGFTLMYSL